MNYEAVMEDIEGNGHYSVLILVLFGSLAFTYSVELNSLIFLSYTPTFKCDNGSMSGGNLTWVTDQCQGRLHHMNGSIVDFFCRKWVYSKSVMTRTMVTDFDLVCGNSAYVTILETVLFVGIALGGFLGIVGDKLGRKRSILVGAMFEATINIILPFVTNFWILLVLRFLWGLGMFKIFQGLCYMSEIITIQKRSMYTNNFWSMYVVAYMLTPGIAFAVRDWRWLRMITNIPMLVYIIYFWLPESPRWLSVMGRHEDAKHALVAIAKRNGLKYSPNRFDRLKIDTEKQGGLIDALKTTEMRKKLFVLMLANGATSLCYFGLSTNSHFISHDIFINVFLQGSVEILTGPLGWLSSSQWNRRSSLTSFQVMTGIFLMISCLMPVHTIILTITKAILAMLGKFFLTSGYCIMDMYLTEVFPTSVRSSATFIILGTASTITALAPTVNKLDVIAPFLSSTVYSAMITLSAVLIFLVLPETKGCPLPQTIFEADQLRRGNEKVFCQLMLNKDEDEKQISTL